MREGQVAEEFMSMNEYHFTEGSNHSWQLHLPSTQNA